MGEKECEGVSGREWERERERVSGREWEGRREGGRRRWTCKLKRGKERDY